MKESIQITPELYKKIVDRVLTEREPVEKVSQFYALDTELVLELLEEEMRRRLREALPLSKFTKNLK